MGATEWCRSRYWLGHFLYSRHERSKIAWQTPVAAGDAERERLRLLLTGGLCARSLGGERLICRAASSHAHDPAFLQTLRLLAKERAYGDDLIRRLGARFGIAARTAPYRPPLAAWLVSLPGVRFEIASLLLHELVNGPIIRLAFAGASDPVIVGVGDALLRDHAAHSAFYAERLTMEFAAFWFARRNLRRYRLRALFSAVLSRAIRRHHDLLSAGGVSDDAFAKSCWSEFDRTLERIVPYHRDALLAALLRQSEKPYDKPSAV